ncbi:entericidin A/B family lipoprotein [Jannaschia sp. S6380]|nr:entericidin A/B family lipoprotein [Jannaschia sp. S6380]MCK0167911.1 entericidin A/B family lipoprotein [Jannaschia sp. S6380]
MKPFLLLTALLTTLAACETIEGAGQDIEDGGQAIQNAAN